MIERTVKRIRLKVRGKTVDVIREQYLRNDIQCRSPLCEDCGKSDAVDCDNSGSEDNFLPCGATHYLIPFPDVALKYLEILEFPEIEGVIFPQTVAHLIQHDGGKRLYSKLRGILQTHGKHAILFLNEFCKQTYCHRNEGEDLRSWQIRNTYNVAVWYYNHLQRKVPIVMVTEDNQVLTEYANKTAGVLLIALGEYLKEFWPNLQTAHDIYESLSALLQLGPISDSTTEYVDYLPMEVLGTGLKSGHYYKGVLKVNEHNTREEAFVVSHSSDQKVLNSKGILIYGWKHRNRAVHDDVVVAELLPRSSWHGRSKILRQNDDGEIVDDNGGFTKTVMPTGKVIGILQRRWRDYVASLPEDENYSLGNCRDHVLVIPYDYRIPKIRIATRQAANLKEDRIVVRIDSWETNSQYPNGHFVRSLGPAGDIQTERVVLLVEHGISVTSSAAVLQELPENTEENPWIIDNSEVVRRKDLRESHLIYSIDPKDCEDVDDALSVRLLPNGNVEVGVHIADVTHFVPFNSLTDREARIRGTTFYMTDQRYDMLPRILSSDLCSLTGNTDRYAVSVLWTLDSDYEIKDVWFGRTVIKSSYKLFYEFAQEIIDKPEEDADIMMVNIPEIQGLPTDEALKRYVKLRHCLLKLTEIAQVLKTRRLEKGALELDSSEVRFEFEGNKSDRIEDIKPMKELVIHETVAEFMVFANCWVAKKIHDHFPGHSILRCHPSPSAENFSNLLLCAEAKGFHMDVSTNKQLSESLERCVDTKDPYVNKLMRNLTVQAMAQALYFSTGSVKPEQFYHYGLATEFYTHFTSPIRRYSDIVAHRQLLAIAENQQDAPGTLSNAILQELCDHLNEQNRASKFAQKASKSLFRAMFFHSLSPEDSRRVTDAMIYAIKANGVLVFVPQYGMKGAVYLRNKTKQVAYVVSKDNVTWMDGTVTHRRLDIKVSTSLGHQTYRLLNHITIYIDVEIPHAHAPSVKMKLVDNHPHPDWNVGFQQAPFAMKHLMKEIRNSDTNSTVNIGSSATSDDMKPKTQQQSLYILLEQLRELSLEVK